ncbi:MAG TPA: DUF1801 domain-containing protein [Cytophagales bacterium]|nr:DUF1801 domain-containing protein [Cytophagales bacterium]HAA22285.1 DUF1801 domain-containing protein [Cytophagales bacterium]HAP57962.1 DUF1801 domain-containing protein [Cytophagales bacterium]
MNKTEEVTQFIAELDNPLKEEMDRVRHIILETSEKMTEDMKWKAPNFVYKGNMATFNPRAKKFVNLTFHKGALIEDTTGLLEGDQKEARVARFHSMEEVEAKKDQLQQVVRAWIAKMDEL